MTNIQSYFQHHFLFPLLCLFVLSFVSSAEGQQPGQAVPVIVKEAKIDRFVDRVAALGTLRANETVDLSATVTDTVTVIHFDDGQRVQAGDILIEMTRTEEHALLEEARSTMDEGMEIKQSYDTSVFVEGAISEVYKTLLIAIGLVNNAGGARPARRSPRGARLSGDAAGFRGGYSKTAAVCHRRQHLSGTGAVAGHPPATDPSG